MAWYICITYTICYAGHTTVYIIGIYHGILNDIVYIIGIYHGILNYLYIPDIQTHLWLNEIPQNEREGEQ